MRGKRKRRNEWINGPAKGRPVGQKDRTARRTDPLKEMLYRKTTRKSHTVKLEEKRLRKTKQIITRQRKKESILTKREKKTTTHNKTKLK